MSHRQDRLRQLAALCDKRRPEDGKDPRHDRKKSTRSVALRKTQQLAKQVRVAIELGLSSAADEVLRELAVLAVEPAPDASHLVVLVTALPGNTATEEEIDDALVRARGYLRGLAATAIHRKKVPNLTLRRLPLGDEVER